MNVKNAVFRKECELLSKESSSMVRKYQLGLITKSELRRKANELAKGYIDLSRRAEHLTCDCFKNGTLERICLKMAVKLKYLAANPPKQPAQPKRAHRGYEIKNKMVTTEGIK